LALILEQQIKAGFFKDYRILLLCLIKLAARIPSHCLRWRRRGPQGLYPDLLPGELFEILEIGFGIFLKSMPEQNVFSPLA